MISLNELRRRENFLQTMVGDSYHGLNIGDYRFSISTFKNLEQQRKLLQEFVAGLDLKIDQEIAIEVSKKRYLMIEPTRNVELSMISSFVSNYVGLLDLISTYVLKHPLDAHGFSGPVYTKPYILASILTLGVMYEKDFPLIQPFGQDSLKLGVEKLPILKALQELEGTLSSLPVSTYFSNWNIQLEGVNQSNILPLCGIGISCTTLNDIDYVRLNPKLLCPLILLELTDTNKLTGNGYIVLGEKSFKIQENEAVKKLKTISIPTLSHSKYSISDLLNLDVIQRKFYQKLGCVIRGEKTFQNLFDEYSLEQVAKPQAEIQVD